MIKMFIKQAHVMKGDQQASLHMSECGGRKYNPTEFSECNEVT